MSCCVYQRLVKVVAVCVVAVAASAGPAEAQVPDAGGQFHACVRVDRDADTGKLMRLVAANEACRANETRLHWNVAGAQGPQGPEGPQGLQGPQGQPGADGVNGTNATRAAGPCFGHDRYIDCGNGTITDSTTGLIWLKQADCLPDANFVDANRAAALVKDGDCGLSDGSAAGDWRLPTAAEWSDMLAPAGLGCTVDNGKAPAITDFRGFQCMADSSTVFVGVRPIWYASSLTLAGSSRALFGLLDAGIVMDLGFGNIVGVWPVRSAK